MVPLTLSGSLANRFQESSARSCIAVRATSARSRTAASVPGAQSPTTCLLKQASALSSEMDSPEGAAPFGVPAGARDGGAGAAAGAETGAAGVAFSTHLNSSYERAAAPARGLPPPGGVPSDFPAVESLLYACSFVAAPAIAAGALAGATAETPTLDGGLADGGSAFGEPMHGAVLQLQCFVSDAQAAARHAPAPAAVPAAPPAAAVAGVLRSEASLGEHGASPAEMVPGLRPPSLGVAGACSVAILARVCSAALDPSGAHPHRPALTVTVDAACTIDSPSKALAAPLPASPAHLPKPAAAAQSGRAPGAGSPSVREGRTFSERCAGGSPPPTPAPIRRRSPWQPAGRGGLSGGDPLSGPGVPRKFSGAWDHTSGSAHSSLQASPAAMPMRLGSSMAAAASPMHTHDSNAGSCTAPAGPNGFTIKALPARQGAGAAGTRGEHAGQAAAALESALAVKLILAPSECAAAKPTLQAAAPAQARQDWTEGVILC